MFESTEVKQILFARERENTAAVPDDDEVTVDAPRPESAIWARKNGTSGSISFKYLVDASGRQGILSTKYLKNRRVNDNFKNVANWAYWKSDNIYGPGTHMQGSPYFEALDDASGWAWFMPLHDGTRSVGIVQDQKQAARAKRDLGRPSGLEYYKLALKMAPTTQNLLAGAELASDVRSASDWSYTASTYHLPNARICGDAGSFIDPLFSSGVHLAITGGLSAAATIAASVRGDCDENTAGAWHSKKTVQSYSRFFLAVSSATKQIREKHLPILQDLNEEGFQRAFDLFRPIIQGTVDNDTRSKVTQAEILKILEFCSKSFTYVAPEQKEALFKKLTKLGVNGEDSDVSWANGLGDLQHHLTADELKVLGILQSRRLTREDPFEIDSFTLDPIDGLAPSLVRGSLGLVKSEQARIDPGCLFSPEFLDGKMPGIREGSIFHSSDEDRLNKGAVETVA
ncbi:Tryptophan 2-halogenase [Beauveria bassiana]|uniref:Tryptophan 2-halogenase n=1 Tax=Beauveria bassiana TaxID=176275 RepID=A0A2N6NWF2_BEABA|nr:Tryptophan 2-halogenase [Beauveria bassiana]